MEEDHEMERNSIQKLLNDQHFEYQHHLIGGNQFQDPDHKNIPLMKVPKKQRKKGVSKKEAKTSKAKCYKNEIKNSENNKGHWLNQQSKRYHWFLEINSRHFIMKKLRRMDKIFKSMADFIGSREAEQCRSHHQKMQKKYKSFYKILKNLRLEFYLSADPIFLKSDFQRNNITQYSPLISQQTLNDVNKQAPNESEQSEYQQQLQLPKNNNENRMLLSDRYEEQFGF